MFITAYEQFSLFNPWGVVLGDKNLATAHLALLHHCDAFAIHGPGNGLRTRMNLILGAGLAS